MQGILFRSICKRSLLAAPLMGWIFLMTYFFYMREAGSAGSEFLHLADMVIRLGMTLIVIFAISGLNAELPKVLFVLPVSRKWRMQYAKKVRRYMFAVGMAGCMAGEAVLTAAEGANILSLVSICVIAFSVMYAMSYSQYFSYKRPGMRGAVVFFVLVNIGLLAACDFSGTFFNMSAEGILITGLCIFVLIMELAVFHRYTGDMVASRADYETSVTMYKVPDNTARDVGMFFGN